MLEILAVILMMSSSVTAATNNNPNYQLPSQQQQNNQNQDKEQDSSCTRASHKKHDHCYQPSQKIRHDGRVWRNGRIIKEGN